MNDRFKFRVWDKEIKTYLRPVKRNLEGSEHDVFITPDGEAFSELQHCINHPEGFIVEQCTGLKDKNGRLIYEGDIISIFDGSQYEIVEWCEGRLGYFVEVQLSAGADFGPECLGNLCDVIEVIGNIHENPELLEAEK